MFPLPCALWLLVAPAAAQEAAPSPEEQLDDARRSYTNGDVLGAREKLEALLALGPALPDAVYWDTLAYMGDIWYSEQSASAAEPFFRALLQDKPDYVMDPLEHPTEVVRFFESLRPPPKPLDVTVVRPPPATPPRGPFPWLAAVPGGVYYFAEGRVGAGLAVAGTQTALLVTNLVLFQQIRAIEGVHADTAEETEWRSLELATDLTGAAFYVSLVVPPLVEVSRWSAQGPRAQLGVGPGSVVLTGSF